MNKKVKFDKKCTLFFNKYLKIGRRAKGLKKYIENGMVLNYLEFENIGLEFGSDERKTYFRDLKSDIDVTEFSRFEDFQKCFYVIAGFYKKHKR